jgi:hypothetical protein
VTCVIGLAFIPRVSVLMVITLELLPPSGRSSQRFPHNERAGPDVPPSSLFFSEGCVWTSLRSIWRAPNSPQRAVTHFA